MCAHRAPFHLHSLEQWSHSTFFCQVYHVWNVFPCPHNAMGSGGRSQKASHPPMTQKPFRMPFALNVHRIQSPVSTSRSAVPARVSIVLNSNRRQKFQRTERSEASLQESRRGAAVQKRNRSDRSVAYVGERKRVEELFRF